jgi:hypothetical protein
MRLCFLVGCPRGSRETASQPTTADWLESVGSKRHLLALDREFFLNVKYEVQGWLLWRNGASTPFLERRHCFEDPTPCCYIVCRFTYLAPVGKELGEIIYIYFCHWMIRGNQKDHVRALDLKDSFLGNECFVTPDAREGTTKEPDGYKNVTLHVHTCYLIDR